MRALELILADALQQGADTLVTGAGPLSNHVRATAALRAHDGLAHGRRLLGQCRRARAEGNHCLSQLLGAEIRFTGDADRGSVDRALEAGGGTQVRAAGRTTLM